MKDLKKWHLVVGQSRCMCTCVRKGAQEDSKLMSVSVLVGKEKSCRKGKEGKPQMGGRSFILCCD